MNALKNQVKLTVETLEDRVVPSVTIVNGDLHINSTNWNDSVTVSYQNGYYRVTENGYTRSFASSRVWGGDVVFRGYDGNDTFRNNTGLRATAYGGWGNDSLYGNSNRDNLYGEGDHDLIAGGSGNDNLYGGDGDDELYGNAGNDYLNGGVGSDWLFGNDGNDTLDGGFDYDYDLAWGGNGSDIFYNLYYDYNDEWWSYWTSGRTGKTSYVTGVNDLSIDDYGVYS